MRRRWARAAHQSGSPGAPARAERSVARRRSPGRHRRRAAGVAVGDDVVHAKWGEGVVLEITGEGDNAEVVVRFPSVGEKRLLLAWAPLKKARSLTSYRWRWRHHRRLRAGRRRPCLVVHPGGVVHQAWPSAG